MSLHGSRLNENDRELIVRYADERRAPNNPVDVNRTNVPSHQQQGGFPGPYPQGNFRNPRNHNGHNYPPAGGFEDPNGLNPQAPPFARRQGGGPGGFRRQGGPPQDDGFGVPNSDDLPENMHQDGNNQFGNGGGRKPRQGMNIHTNFDSAPFPPSYANSKPNYGPGNSGNNQNSNSGNGRGSSLSINTNMASGSANANTNTLKSTIPTTPTIQSNNPTNGYNTYLYANPSFMQHQHGLVLPSPGMSPFGSAELPPHIFFPPSPLSPMPHPYGPPAGATPNTTSTKSGNSSHSNDSNSLGQPGTSNSNAANNSAQSADGPLSINTAFVNNGAGGNGAPGFPSPAPYGYGALPPGVQYATFPAGPPGNS